MCAEHLLSLEFDSAAAFPTKYLELLRVKLSLGCRAGGGRSARGAHEGVCGTKGWLPQPGLADEIVGGGGYVVRFKTAHPTQAFVTGAVAERISTR